MRGPASERVGGSGGAKPPRADSENVREAGGDEGQHPAAVFVVQALSRALMPPSTRSPNRLFADPNQYFSPAVA